MSSKEGGSFGCHQGLCFTLGDARDHITAHLQLCLLTQRPEQGDLLLIAGRDAEDLVPAGRQSHQHTQEGSQEQGERT